MEHIALVLNNEKEFDEAVHGGNGIRVLPDDGQLKIITKDVGTVSGRAVAVLTFGVDVDGKGDLCRAQTVVSVKMLLAAARVLRGRYNEEGFADMATHQTPQ